MFRVPTNADGEVLRSDLFTSTLSSVPKQRRHVEREKASTQPQSTVSARKQAKSLATVHKTPQFSLFVERKQSKVSFQARGKTKTTKPMENVPATKRTRCSETQGTNVVHDSELIYLD